MRRVIVGAMWLAAFAIAAGDGARAQMTPGAPLSEPQALQLAARFVDQVVRVVPRRLADGSLAPAGFGLLIGERGGHLYIATPFHVAWGDDRPSALTDAPGILFRADRFAPPAPALRLRVASPSDDLAVLELPAPAGVTLSHTPMVDATRVPRATWVWNIGIGEEWDMPDRAGGLGPLQLETGLRRVGQLNTPPGASGGAAVTTDGLIGMLERDAGTYSLVLPIDRIVTLFRAWDLPVNLVAPEAQAVPVVAEVLPASPPALLNGSPQALLPGSPPAPVARKAGEVFRDCPECPEMVVIPGGRFVMGSPDGEESRYSEEGPQHPVTIASFAAGKFDVTFAEWDACATAGGCGGYRPDDRGWGRGSRPVIYVSWEDAQAYVTWLSSRTGQSYRLLTEAEWEYAARAGTTTAFWTGTMIRPDQAQYDWTYSYAGSPKRPSYEARTSPVGTFAPNGFGLYDMAGNVWQWVRDCYWGSYRDAPGDGSAVEGRECRTRVLRGGSWVSEPRSLRSAHRNGNSPDNRSSDVGFRVARTL